MGKMITRTFKEHTIHVVQIKVVDGEVTTLPMECIVINENTINAEKALKAVRKVYGKDGQFAVTNIVTKEVLRSQPEESFISNSKIISEKIITED